MSAGDGLRLTAMSPRRWSLRCAALLGAGALAVHELRYAIAYRGHAYEALAQQGHGYLAMITPLVVGVAALALTAFGRSLAAEPIGSTRAGPGGRVWAGAAAALMIMHFGQEWTEGLLARGHPAGLAGTFGPGGLAAVGLCVAFGGLVALALRGAHAGAGLTVIGRRANVAFPRATAIGGARAQAPPRPVPLAAGQGARAPPRAFA